MMMRKMRMKMKLKQKKIKDKKIKIIIFINYSKYKNGVKYSFKKKIFYFNTDKVINYKSIEINYCSYFKIIEI